MMIANLRAKLLTLDAEHSKWKETNFTVRKDFDESKECRVDIEKFATDYIQQQLNEHGGASVIELFMQLKQKIQWV